MSEYWRQQADRHNTSIEDIKKTLPLEWVVSVAAGVHLSRVGDGRSQGQCPFHADSNPSFDVYAYGDRWGCYPCAKGGDIFDFIGEYWELVSFGARFEKALDLLDEFKADAGPWASAIGPAVEAKPVTVEELSHEVQISLGIIQRDTTEPIVQLLQKKDIFEIDEDWLIRTWRLGVTAQGEVLAPYFDVEGKVVSYKTRFPHHGGWFTRKGTKLTSLYGEWQLKGTQAEADIWLCEGETDTWLASYLMRGRGIALGLPAGAGSRIRDEWIEIMRDKRVTLVMDADKAGRTAARRWWEAIHSVAREVSISFPQSDLCDSRDPRTVLESGKIVPDSGGFTTIRADGRVYQALTANGPGEQLSNFVFVPTKQIVYRDTLGQAAYDGYEGHFADQSNKRLRIKETDLKDARTLRDWAIANGRAWLGSSAKHPQSILMDLQAQAPFLKTEEAVQVAGLHGSEQGNSVFVLPPECGPSIGSPIGMERWTFTRGAAYDIGNRFRLGVEDKPIDISILRDLHQLHRQDVMSPIIAWMVTAPLRSLCKNYPPLVVLGGSGSGKTTLMLTIMEHFWGWTTAEQNLTNTTPYAVKQASASTNGLPIWWDEFRRGARPDTFEAMNQVIRDSWTGSVSQRGGMGDNLSRVEQTAAIAPLVVSGEAGLEEKSLRDRAVVVRLPLDGRNSDALDRIISDSSLGALGKRLIEWQLRELDAGNPLVALGAPHIKDRQKQGVAVLEWGWKMWKAFLKAEWDIGTMGQWEELDLTIVTTQREGDDETPEITALIDMLQQRTKWKHGDRTPVAWIEDREADVVCVRKEAFHNAAVRDGHVLPGGPSATIKVLMDRFPSIGDRAYYDAGGGDKFQVRAARMTGVLAYLAGIGVDVTDRRIWES